MIATLRVFAIGLMLPGLAACLVKQPEKRSKRTDSVAFSKDDAQGSKPQGPAAAPSPSSPTLSSPNAGTVTDRRDSGSPAFSDPFNGWNGVELKGSAKLTIVPVE